MSVISLDRRLRKVEGRQRGPGGGPWFFVWGRTAEEIEERLVAFPGPKPSHGVQPVHWTFDEEVPQPRWATAASLSDREMMSVLEDRAGPIGTWPTSGPEDPRARQMTDAMLDDALLAAVLAEEVAAC